MDAAFLRSKAGECRCLADITVNLEIRRRLDDLAKELEDKAAATETQNPGNQHH
jgi:hypothetical protein